ncbi:hypothetical protein GGX14DRAFT_648551 [Mycena pura]|uniref:BTB domain-containing protein n=1 Tax=Mycena pura TaxID=153505 RepID=A0AAD6YMN2_9AGAR|nr:hypothetical protein GGX14DRAFT_648551 [Mycena pura]
MSDVVAEGLHTYNESVPFNDEGADVIVRSSEDKVDFRVHRAVLSMASPFFGTMFSLPQGDTAVLGGNTRDGLPVVEFAEDKGTLAVLLRLCYPAHMVLDCIDALRLLPTIELVLSVLVAADKYQMDGVERLARSAFVDIRFLDSESPALRLFALAVKNGLHAEAKVWARHTLSAPVLGQYYIRELEYITAATYHRLQTYHVLCGLAAHMVAQNLRWITNEATVWFECSACRGSTPVVLAGERRKWPARWWADFMVEASSALKERPSGRTVSMDSDTVQMAMERASACPTCRTRVFREMREFCGNFAVEVDKETALVDIEIQ